MKRDYNIGADMLRREGWKLQGRKGYMHVDVAVEVDDGEGKSSDRFT